MLTLTPPELQPRTGSDLTDAVAALRGEISALGYLDVDGPGWRVQLVLALANLAQRVELLERQASAVAGCGSDCA